jgi:hypothetical protein
MALIDRALSVRQPWAELILQGVKRLEYRPKRTNIRERVYIYASLTPADNNAAWRRSGHKLGELPVGIIIGSVEIVGCRVDGRIDEYAYVLANPRRLRKPLKPKNQPLPAFWRPEF